MPESTRKEVYQGLLRAMGHYKPVWVDNTSTGESIHATDEGALKQAVTWVVEGDDVCILTHHVWGVGGGATSRFTGTRWKHRYVRWNGDGWDVDTQQKVHHG